MIYQHRIKADGETASGKTKEEKMRLIDADAYAAEMKKRQDACMKAVENASYEGEQFSPKEHWRGVLAAFAEAKLTLDDMPTIDGWISVKDRLPESIINKVLVWLEHDDLVGYIGFGHYEKYKGQEIWFDLEHSEAFSVRGYTVTHWMPLPEPPKEVTGDE